ncbi:MAG TPA: hypothetical protein VF469_03475 [Kofleriaceae bacterium]
MSVAEVEQISLIRCIVEMPQASPAQDRAFDRLVAMILPELDRYARRPYLPDDEADAVAIRVIAKLRHKNFENLRAFIGKLDDDPTWRFETWLRKLCRWKISHRLDRLLRSGLLALDDDPAETIDNEIKSTTLIIGKLIRSETCELSRCLLEKAADGLDERQCIALHLYYRFTEDAPEGKRQASTRAAYAEIASQLALDDTTDAIRLVTTAKQRLERAVRRLREIEAADPWEDGS